MNDKKITTRLPDDLSTMSPEHFYKEVERILGNLPPEKVKEFMEKFNFSLVGVLSDIIDMYRYRKVNKKNKDQVIEDSEKALLYLKRIASDYLYAFHHQELMPAIKVIESTLEWNESNKPNGRLPKLKNGDLNNLRVLQDVFRECFPDEALRFDSEKEISELGELLLGKPLPKTADEQVSEFRKFLMS